MKARVSATSLHARPIPPLSVVSSANSSGDLIVSPKKSDAIFTLAEVDDLKRLEKAIEKGLKTELTTKVEIGRALLEIKEKKLYHPHTGVIEYAIERFGMSRTEVSNRMGFAEIDAVKKESGLQGALTNDAQHRPLLSLLNRQNRKDDPAIGEKAKQNIVKVVKAVAEAAKDRKAPVTAKMVADAVKEVIPATEADEANGKKASAKKAEADGIEEPQVVPPLPAIPGFEYTGSVYFHGSDAQADTLQAVLHEAERNGGDGTFELICGTNDRHAFLMTVDAWLAANQVVERVEIYLHRKHGVAEGNGANVVEPGIPVAAESPSEAAA